MEREQGTESKVEEGGGKEREDKVEGKRGMERGGGGDESCG